MVMEYDNTGQLIDAVKRATVLGLKAAGIHIHQQAVENAPVDTGNLKGSLSWTIDGELGGLNAPGGKPPKSTPKRATPEDGVRRTNETEVVYVGTNVHYGVYMEYGTSKAGQQSFLRSALDAVDKDLPKIMSDHYQKGMRGVVR